MSKETQYQLISNPQIGFSINEENEYVTIHNKTEKTGRKIYELWIDDYEGGEANIMDWNYIDEFKTEELAMDYIIKNYGEVKEL